MTTPQSPTSWRHRINWPLTVALGLPILFIVIVFLVLYLPQAWHKPAYDFVYTDGSYPNTIIDRNVSSQANRYLYYHDTETNRSHSLTLEQYQALTVLPDRISPDDYVVKEESYGSGLGELFFYSSERSVFLSKGLYNRPLQIEVSAYSFNFLGWVKR